MMKLGADYNYTEYTDIDLLLSNKILIDKIYLKIKKDRLCEGYSKITNTQKVDIGKRDYLDFSL